MTDERDIRSSREGDDARDAALSGVLQALDPAREDPTFWLRFHQRVMGAARAELARRRMMVYITVEEVVVSWGRAVVPAALLAAAVAALMLLRSPAVPVTPVTIEELLAESADGSPVPAAMMTLPELDGAGVMFASSGF